MVTVARRQLLIGLAAILSLNGCAWLFEQPRDNTLGFEPGRLQQAFRQGLVEDSLHTMLIARDGQIYGLYRYQGDGPDALTNIKSASKSVLSALVGIAIDRGVFSGVDQPLVTVLGRQVPRGADPRVATITLGHLLSMQGGLQGTSGSNYGSWVSSRDWVEDALLRPFVAQPGGEFVYSTGSYHLLGAALTAATGQDLHRLARAWLGDPLGIDIPAWDRDPQGRYFGGNNMRLTPRGLFRFGELYRLGGVYNGRRILSEDWIKASWEPRSRSATSGDRYGYGWYLANLANHEVRYARGYGGQMIYIVPELAITVVMTSQADRRLPPQGYLLGLHRLMAQYIIPAAR